MSIWHINRNSNQIPMFFEALHQVDLWLFSWLRVGSTWCWGRDGRSHTSKEVHRGGHLAGWSGWSWRVERDSSKKVQIVEIVRLRRFIIQKVNMIVDRLRYTLLLFLLGNVHSCLVTGIEQIDVLSDRICLNLRLFLDFFDSRHHFGIVPGDTSCLEVYLILEQGYLGF